MTLLRVRSSGPAICERQAAERCATTESENVSRCFEVTQARSKKVFIIVLNRSGPMDSELSLDEAKAFGDSWAMIWQPYHLYAERTDRAKNMARYYAMEISETLFGEPCLVRRWGRIGTSGRSLTQHFEREGDAVKLFLELLRKKKSRGYRPKSLNPGQRVEISAISDQS